MDIVNTVDFKEEKDEKHHIDFESLFQDLQNVILKKKSINKVRRDTNNLLRKMRRILNSYKECLEMLQSLSDANFNIAHTDGKHFRWQYPILIEGRKERSTAIVSRGTMDYLKNYLIPDVQRIISYQQCAVNGMRQVNAQSARNNYRERSLIVFDLVMSYNTRKIINISGTSDYPTFIIPTDAIHFVSGHKYATKQVCNCTKIGRNPSTGKWYIFGEVKPDIFKINLNQALVDINANGAHLDANIDSILRPGQIVRDKTNNPYNPNPNK
jgi:hypothetical protein